MITWLIIRLWHDYTWGVDTLCSDKWMETEICFLFCNTNDFANWRVTEYFLLCLFGFSHRQMWWCIAARSAHMYQRRNRGWSGHLSIMYIIEVLWMNVTRQRRWPRTPGNTWALHAGNNADHPGLYFEHSQPKFDTLLQTHINVEVLWISRMKKNLMEYFTAVRLDRLII